MKLNSSTDLRKVLMALPLLAAAHVAQAEVVDLEISNLTQGIYFTPLLVTAHAADTHLFQLGQPASAALQAMAEGGDISGLATAAESLGAVNVENPAGGLLGPSARADVMDFDTGSYGYLSLTAMLLPTNDGFVGLDSWKIPDEPGQYTIYLNAYDAGTEANDEILNEADGGMPGTAGFPANPGANGGTAATGVTSSEPNTHIHVHPGNVGDTNESGGLSDLDSRIHRWLNPVAKVVVTVK